MSPDDCAAHPQHPLYHVMTVDNLVSKFRNLNYHRQALSTADDGMFHQLQITHGQSMDQFSPDVGGVGLPTSLQSCTSLSSIKNESSENNSGGIVCQGFNKRKIDCTSNLSTKRIKVESDLTVENKLVPPKPARLSLLKKNYDVFSI